MRFGRAVSARAWAATFERMSRSTRCCLFLRRSRTSSSRLATARPGPPPRVGLRYARPGQPRCGSTRVSAQTRGQARQDRVRHEPDRPSSGGTQPYTEHAFQASRAPLAKASGCPRNRVSPSGSVGPASCRRMRTRASGCGTAPDHRPIHVLGCGPLLRVIVLEETARQGSIRRMVDATTRGSRSCHGCRKDVPARLGPRLQPRGRSLHELQGLQPGKLMRGFGPHGTTDRQRRVSGCAGRRGVAAGERTTARTGCPAGWHRSCRRRRRCRATVGCRLPARSRAPAARSR